MAKKNKIEKVWWTGLTVEDMKSISKKKPKKKTSGSWSDEYSDVDRSKNNHKKSSRKK